MVRITEFEGFLIHELSRKFVLHDACFDGKHCCALSIVSHVPTNPMRTRSGWRFNGSSDNGPNDAKPVFGSTCSFPPAKRSSGSRKYLHETAGNCSETCIALLTLPTLV